MNRSVSDQVTNATLAAKGETQEVALPYRHEVVPMDGVASTPIVQCLLIAAWRGRQIRLAREQAAQRQQSEPGLACEETPLHDEI